MLFLNQDNASSLAGRVQKTDACEIEGYYQRYYSQYIQALDKGGEANRAQLGKAYQTAGVLFEVLCAVNKTEKVEEVAPEVGSKWIPLMTSIASFPARTLFDKMPHLLID